MRRLLLPIAGLCGLLAPATAGAEGAIDYVGQVKPILAGRCYACHGALKQKGGFRADSVKALTEGGDGGPAVEPGKADESRLVELIADSGDARMPPPGEGEALGADQIALIKTWIDQGAAAPPDDAPEPDPREHWAFLAPPESSGPAAEVIDAIISADLASHHLAPQPTAPKGLLQRRLHLGLIGVPPTAEERAAFLADDSPDAYEAMVDRLLASRAYAERWGRHWMDVWRYSDAWGLGAEVRNSQKHIWHWRDWIIESLAEDKGYDRMVREMVAGDELNPGDLDALRATGFLARNYFKFNRNTWLDEVVEHTGKAFLGLTLNCAKCHDHKFDPISQEEYYRFRAFFEPYQVRTEQVPGQPDFEKDGIPRAFDANPDAPTYRFVRGDESRPATDRPLRPGVPSLLAWGDLEIVPVALPPEASRPGLRPFILEDQLRAADVRLQTARAELAAARESLAVAESGAAPASTPTGTGFRDDFASARPDLWSPKGGRWGYEAGKLVQAEPAAVRSEYRAAPDPPADFQAALRFTIVGGDPWRSVGLAFDAAEGREVLVYLSAHEGGPKLQVALRREGADSYPEAGARSRPIKPGVPYELTVRVRGTLVNVSIDGEHALAYRLPAPREPGGVAIVTFAAQAEFTTMELAALPPDVALVESGKPAFLGATAVDQARARVAVAEKAFATAEAHPDALRARAAADRARRETPPADDAKALAVAAVRAERREALAKAEEALARLESQPEAGAPEEAAKKREAAVAAVAAARKAVDEEGEGYTPLRGALKAVESPTDTEAPNVLTFPDVSTGRRTALANWLTDRRNPLTARVAVNHVWARHFGRPLVATVFDFGRHGARPTHPELLDRLAAEFMADGWSLKRLHKRIVMSQAYRRSSSSSGADPATLAADPENLHYWRMNPVRMEAQAVRDSLLSLAGELSDEAGGPPVPLEQAKSSPRRSVYFVHSHNERDKFLSTFDDAGVQDCYRREESIVPVQALALWNSGLAQAMAGKVAARVAGRLGEAGDDRFVAEAFGTILGAPPTADESSACERALADLRALLKDRGAADADRRAREILVQSLLNHNDFITVR